jgi:hypothetical protein
MKGCVEGDWTSYLTAFGPVLVVLVAAAAAWWYKHHERLQDAYAAWAGAIHRHAYLSVGSSWNDTTQAQIDKELTNISVSRAKVLLLERVERLRGAVILLSDMHDLGEDAPERVGLKPPKELSPHAFFFWRKIERVDALIIALAEAGLLGRDEVRLTEPHWEPLPKTSDVERNRVRNEGRGPDR